MAISSAVSASRVARVLGIETVFKDLSSATAILPQRIALIGQGSSSSTYDTTKATYTSAAAIGSAYGYGSPLHLAARQLLPSNGDGIGSIPLVVFPLEDDESGVAATGSITPLADQTEQESYTVLVNNIESEEFVISASDDVATITASITTAINSNINMPVIAVDDSTSVTLTAKWAGTSSNDVYVEMDTDGDSTFTITQLSGGLINPDVQDALDLFGDVWYTMVLNCMEYDDEDTLDTLYTHGEGRWGSLTRKPYVAFRGCTEADRSTATSITETRTEDYINVQLVAPGSNDLPFCVAARQLARIAVVANENPPRDYGSQPTDIEPGDDEDQWLATARNTAVLAGSSTVEVRDSVLYISDVITSYNPDDEDTPAYRYVCDIVKLQNCLYNFDLEFASDEWDGAPLIPDDQDTTNRSAKKPKMAVAAACKIITALGLSAIISDPDTAKENTSAEIDDSNPKRLNLVTTLQLSGNTNIISATLNFGFYFGTSAIVT